MRIVRLDHVQLAMPPGSEATAIAFYEGVLGIPQVPKPPEFAVRGGCWFEDGDVRIHLGAEEDFRPARKAHPALIVDDLESLLVFLASDGVGFRQAEDVDGRHRVHIDDPFGNRLELIDAG